MSECAYHEATQDHAHEGGVARVQADADRLFGGFVDRMLAGESPRRACKGAGG